MKNYIKKILMMKKAESMEARKAFIDKTQGKIQVRILQKIESISVPSETKKAKVCIYGIQVLDEEDYPLKIIFSINLWGGYSSAFSIVIYGDEYKVKKGGEALVTFDLVTDDLESISLINNTETISLPELCGEFWNMEILLDETK